ncbi:MAG: hypothetical protein K2P58_00250 [Hyphomonadaceae bacterium]|nr:hypothetical protein [Hyphomonadaceae bacterium]
MAKTRLIRLLQAAAVIVVALLAVGLYRAKSDAARAETRVRALNLEIAEREARLRELRSEIATLESPGRIEQLAEERLGLVVGQESAALPQSAIDDHLPEAGAAP